MSARIHPLTDGTAGKVHSYLLEEDDGLTLIDTLSSDRGEVVKKAIADLGRPIGDLRRIVLTHSHRSHVRGAAHLRRESGAKVYASGFEGETITGARPPAPTGFIPKAPLQVYYLQFGLTLGAYLERAGIRWGKVSAPPCEVDVEIRDGDMVGSLQAIHTPGHTDGSMSFYWPAERAVFCGDVLVTWPRLEAGWAGLSVDMEANRRSLSQLAEVGEVNWICTGHGPPLTEDAAEKVSDLLAGAAAGP